MQHKFTSNITGEVIVFIVVLLIYWFINTIVSMDSNPANITITFSVSIIIVTSIFFYAFIKHTYLLIDGNSIKYVHTFIHRKQIQIPQIETIQTGVVAGFLKFLMLTYNLRGEKRRLLISPQTFRKEKLKEFIFELKKINPKIQIHESVNMILRPLKI